MNNRLQNFSPKQFIIQNDNLFDSSVCTSYHHMQRKRADKVNKVTCEKGKHSLINLVKENESESIMTKSSLNMFGFVSRY